MNSSDEYDYNYNDTVSSIPVDQWLPVSIVYGITLLLGVVGNSLVIFCILKYQRMRSITNILLLSLASADLLLVLICVPIKVSLFLVYFATKSFCLFLSFFFFYILVNLGFITSDSLTAANVAVFRQDINLVSSDFIFSRVKIKFKILI